MTVNPLLGLPWCAPVDNRLIHFMWSNRNLWRSDLALALISALVVVSSGLPMQNSSDQDQITIAISKLSSSHERDRSDGKEDIRRIGQSAAAALVAILSELVVNQRPRFARDQAEFGESALSEYIHAASAKSGPLRGRRNAIMVASEKLASLAINARLMADIVSLLGELRAEQAVPILIEIMNRYHVTETLGGPEVYALIQIGDAAVPLLINDLDESNIRNYNLSRVLYGFSLVVPSEHTTNPNRLPRRRNVHSGGSATNVLIASIQGRVAWILGNIGDQRSIAPLQELLSGTRDKSLKARIVEALAKIQKETPADSGLRQSLPGPRPPS